MNTPHHVVVALLIALLWTAPAAGQGDAAPKGGWTPPKMADGTPDIQGTWDFSHYPDGTLLPGSPAASIEAYAPTPFRRGAPSLITDPANGRIPYRPEALKIKRSLTDLADHAPLGGIDPNAYCTLQGVPRSAYAPGGVQTLQTPGAVTILGEFGHSFRFIPTDGRPRLPRSIPLWQGDARGRWEGNTLVVEVTNLNGKPWMDSVGNFTSEDFRVTERWTPLDPNALLYEATIDSPKLYTRPWKMSFRMRRQPPGHELFEHACHEGEKSFEHIVDAHPEVLRFVK